MGIGRSTRSTRLREREARPVPAPGRSGPSPGSHPGSMVRPGACMVNAGQMVEGVELLTRGAECGRPDVVMMLADVMRASRRYVEAEDWDQRVRRSE